MMGVTLASAAIAAGAVMAAWWAWRLHQQGLALLHRTSPCAPEAPGPPRADTTMSTGWWQIAPGADSGPVLGWERLRLVSVVGDGVTVILACRPWCGRRGSRGAARLQPDDRTIVLRLGGGDMANRAMLLLERWYQEGAWLQLRTAPVEGTVELADQGTRSTLRAPLVAA